MIFLGGQIRFFAYQEILCHYTPVISTIEIIRANAEKRRIFLSYEHNVSGLPANSIINYLAKVTFPEICIPEYERKSGRSEGRKRWGYHPKARSVISHLENNFSISAFDTISMVFQSIPTQLTNPAWNGRTPPERITRQTTDVVTGNIVVRRSVLGEGNPFPDWIDLAQKALKGTHTETQIDIIRTDITNAVYRKNFRLDKVDLICQVLQCAPHRMLDPGWNGIG